MDHIFRLFSVAERAMSLLCKNRELGVFPYHWPEGA